MAYTRRELLDYLPMGWNLGPDPADGAGAGDAWQATVVDGADQPWTLEVAAREIAEVGRVEALRRAMDRLYREALG